MKSTTPPDKALAKAFATLENEAEINNLLHDLLTPQEIKEFANRLCIAQMLWEEKLNYKQIAARCHTSTTTVTRVNTFLRKKKFGGYRTVLKRLQTS